MSLTLREIKLIKQRRKKSGPPCGVDFKRELTSSMLTSRGFHCMKKLLLPIEVSCRGKCYLYRSLLHIIKVLAQALNNHAMFSNPLYLKARSSAT